MLSIHGGFDTSLIALGNGNGGYFIEDFYRGPIFSIGTIDYVNDNAIAVTCYNDYGVALFKLDKEKKEAYGFGVGFQNSSGLFKIPYSVEGCEVVSLKAPMELYGLVSVPSSVKYIGKGVLEHASPVLYYIGDDLSQLKSVQVEEGAFSNDTTIYLAEGKVITGAEFMKHCTVIPASN